jgi:MinD-like ATPase involved in chromosome partitioning or flagellar assembly
VNPIPARTRFVAFYSYKGGVGRTLALANCARVLAAEGKRVLLMDFDLEAPGLQHFEVFCPKKPDGALPGFSEYLECCINHGPPESLSNYIHESRGQQTDKGKAWLMPAGRHEAPTYLSFLNGKSWSDFYSLQEGYKILENLRGQIIAEYSPDYVLMDARTGLSEIGGIATHQLADIVVLVFNLNDQNLSGAVRVFKSIQAVAMKPKVILTVSPVPVVPVEKNTPFEKKMRRIKKDFQGAHNAENPLVIPYHPMLAFSERILVDDHDDPFASDAAYRQLTGLIKELAKDADIYLLKAQREQDIYKSKNHLLEGLAHNPENPHLLYSLGHCYFLENESQKVFDTCNEILQSIRAINQASLYALEAMTLVNQSIALVKLEKPQDALDILREMLAGFGGNNKPQLHGIIARALSLQSKILSGQGKYDEALESYQQLLSNFVDSDQPELQFQSALAFQEKALILEQLERYDDALLATQAFMARFGEIERFEMQESTAICLQVQGNALNKLGRDEEALQAYEQLSSRFHANKRPEIREVLGEALMQQGITLIRLAQREKLAGNQESFVLRLEKAKDILETAKQCLDVGEDSILLQIHHAYLLFLQGDREASADLLKQAFEIDREAAEQACREAAQNYPLPEDDDFLECVSRI